MYAVIRTGGKQYQVSVGDVIEVEKIPQDAGSEVLFNEVLMLGTGKEFQVGQPLLDKVKVTGEIMDQFRDKKVLTFKHKRRKNYRKTIGHRQDLTRVRIKEIGAE